MAFPERLAQACAWIERQPGEEFGWQALAQIVGGDRADQSASALLAAARLGVEARFSALDETTPAPHGYWAWLCPGMMLYFLFRVTGIPATEAQAMRTKGEDYREYQRTTSAFVPWFPREGSHAR